MSADYKPGTVAKATVYGEPDVLVFRDSDVALEPRWAHSTVKGWLMTGDESVTDIRPLVVLDLDPTVVIEKLGAQRNEPQRLVDMLREAADNFFTPDAATLARRVADQIEAQTKPPRIPEPGLWGVVEATSSRLPRRRWVHHEEGRWVCDAGVFDVWENLSNPVLVREGVES